MSRLRVLSISTLFPSPARPAFGQFVAAQARGIAARDDVDLTVINPVGIPPWPLSLREPWKTRKAQPEETVLDGVPIHHPRFTAMPRMGDSNPARIVRAVLPLARRLHAEAPFDVIDAQFFFPDGPAAAAIARDLGLPLTIKARGSDIHFWGERHRALAQMLAAADQAARILAVSGALRDDMAALGLEPAKIAVHYTGLDRARFRPIPRATARAAVADRFGIAAEGPLIVTPGALIAIKGQRFVIEAMAKLRGARLALAGSGEDEAALRAQALGLGIAQRVHLLGQVPHDDLPLLMSAADAVVLPSEREGLANVWVEALACGTPLVIPDIGGAREVVHSAQAGLIAPRDAAAIAGALRELLAAGLEQADVARCAERFSWEVNAAELAGIWHQAAGRT